MGSHQCVGKNEDGRRSMGIPASVLYRGYQVARVIAISWFADAGSETDAGWVRRGSGLEFAIMTG